jgi:hypothetical protein
MHWGRPMAPTMFVSFVRARSLLWPRARRRFYVWLGTLPSPDKHDRSHCFCCVLSWGAIAGSTWWQFLLLMHAVVRLSYTLEASTLITPSHTPYRLNIVGSSTHQRDRDRFITFCLLEFLLHTVHNQSCEKVTCIDWFVVSYIRTIQYGWDS